MVVEHAGQGSHKGAVEGVAQKAPAHDKPAQDVEGHGKEEIPDRNACFLVQKVRKQREAHEACGQKVVLRAYALQAKCLQGTAHCEQKEIPGYGFRKLAIVCFLQHGFTIVICCREQILLVLMFMEGRCLQIHDRESMTLVT